MNITSFGEHFLQCIEIDIEEKYKISNPIFIYNFNYLKDRDEIVELINTILRQDRVIKYKFLDNFFVLKDFYPDPSEKICDKLISKFIAYIKNKTKDKYDIDKIYFRIGSIIYNEDEIIKELFFGLKEGKSRIWEEIDPISDPNPNKARLIYDVNFYQETEPEQEIDSGFLELENKY
ncbi:hypothetical protein GF322_02820 [Candidatus Dependentiae bacterium]|nr:hypothetical protein [Candidatus Dependentiae bacterium]